MEISEKSDHEIPSGRCREVKKKRKYSGKVWNLPGVDVWQLYCDSRSPWRSHSQGHFTVSLQNSQSQRRGATESRTNISRMAAYRGLNSNKGDKTILSPAELSLKCEWDKHTFKQEEPKSHCYSSNRHSGKDLTKRGCRENNSQD